MFYKTRNHKFWIIKQLSGKIVIQIIGRNFMIFSQLNMTYQHAKRYKQIVDVIIKYGFGFIIERLGLILPKGLNKKDVKEDRLSFPQRLVLMLEELGPTFIKLGQILSTRPDILPREYIEELAKLQDDVESVDFKKIKFEIEDEFGQKIDELFLYFKTEPIAAASIGQVHKAALKDGKNVVVKVKRPGIDKVVKTDLAILLNIARLAEKKIPEIRMYEPVEKIMEFAENLKKELDYTHEGWNIERFKQNFAKDDTIYAPEVFWDYTTKKVLTMEYIDGIKINQVDEISKLGLSRKMIAVNGAKAIMKQIFIHGYFHADPHPGNILVLKDGRVVFIDFGMMGRIDEYTKQKLSALIIHIINKNSRGIVDVLLEIGVANKKTNLAEFELDIDDIVTRYYGKTLEQIDMAQLINEMFMLLAKHRITIPSKYTLLLKSIITIEGVGRELDPDFDVVEVAKPFVKKIIKQRYNPIKILKDANKFLIELGKGVSLFPKMMENISDKLENESIKLDFEAKGSEKILFELNKMVNRLVFALIVASLIIGTSLIVQANIGPYLYDIPILAVLSFAAAGILGIGLIFSILRSGRM